MTAQPARSEYADAVIQLWEVGMPASWIASALGGKSKRTLQRWLHDAGLGRLNDDERRMVITHVHGLRHDGASMRAIVADLAGKGIPRIAMSVGWVHSALKRWHCPDCSQTPNGVGERGSVNRPHPEPLHAPVPGWLEQVHARQARKQRTRMVRAELDAARAVGLRARHAAKARRAGLSR